MSLLERLKTKSAERHLFKVVEDEVPLRCAASHAAALVGSLEYGQVVLLRDVTSDGWARLDEDQAWAGGLAARADGAAPSELRPAFVCLGGQGSGLPASLRREDAALEDWEFAEALRCAESNGAPWRKLPNGLRPLSLLELAWLSPWHSPDGTLLAAPPLRDDPARYLHEPLPRLCVVTLVRGVSAEVLESLVSQHHANGFELVMLYFDAPDDPAEAAAIAAAERLTVSRTAGPGGLKCAARVVRCTEAWWRATRANSRYYLRETEPLPLYAETVRLDAEVRDVQARQMLIVEHALLQAQAERFHWLLHVDADELLFCPDEERHADARRFFSEVPMHFTCVRFANLEAVPESMEITNPFREVTLFKMNPALLAELGVEPRMLACGDVAEEDEEREPDLFSCHHADTVPGAMRHGYVRLPRCERHALRRLLRAMHSIAEKRAPTLEQLNVQLDPISEPSIMAKADDDSDFSDDESCYGPRPHCPAFFNSYSNGKCAVRTEIGPRGELPPLPAGVHGFVRDGGAPLYTLLCKGPGAPVVLHYANCGVKAWRRKYETICKGHGTEDGAFCTSREGISEMRSHLAARQLTLRGEGADLERFYRTFVQGNENDEMAYLAQLGLVLRLDVPRVKL